MPVYINTRGVVIKETKVGDSDLILTVLTEDYGKISVSARGVRKSKSRFGGARFLCWSEFSLFKGNRGYSVNDCNLIKSFHNISSNIESLTLASYCSEIIYTVCQEKVKEPKLLRLLLNTFYVIENNKLPLKQIKAVFELRTACAIGYTPDFTCCKICGSCDELFVTDNGEVLCSECGKYSHNAKSAHSALCFIVCAPEKNIFSFKCSDEVLEAVSNVCEQYLLSYVEFSPKTLPLLKDLFT